MEMVDVKAWIADLQRKVKRGEVAKKEVINFPSPMERLEKEGFKQVFKTDNLVTRINLLKEQLWIALQIVHSSEFTIEEKGLAVDKAFNLTTATAVAWLRSMDNPDLERRLLALNSNFREWRPMPAMFDQILEECIAVIDKSYCNIDVEPLTPIIIFAPQPQKREDMTSANEFGNE